MDEETKHAEGDNFRVHIHMHSDANFDSYIHICTDYEGYKRICALTEELDPAKEDNGKG